MTLESEIDNQRKRIMMLFYHVAVLQRKVDMIEDKKARTVLSNLVGKLVTKRVLTMQEHDWIFKQK